MKKISALFIIAVFMLSLIPMAFAENAEAAGESGAGVISVEGDDQGESNDTEVDDSGEADEPAVAIRARPVLRQQVRAEARADLAEANRERLEVRQEARAELLERVRLEGLQARRELAKERLEQFRNRYEQAKEQWEQAKERYMEQKQKFKDAKEQYQECKGVDSDVCNDKRGKLKEQAKPHLIRAADLVLKELERIKAKVEANEDLSEDEVAEILAELDERISEVEDAKEAIESLDDDAPNDEYNQAVRTLRAAWQKAKMSLKRHVGLMANARLGNIILRTEMLEKRFYTARDKLESQGYDVSELDKQLVEFSAHLDDAANAYNDARDLWSSANTPGEVDGVAEEVHDLLSKAKESLGNAKELLRDIVSEIKGLNSGSVDVGSDDESDEEADDASDDLGDDQSDDDSDVEEEEESEDEDSCDVDADCDADESCDEGECEDLEEDTCEADEDCDADEFCDAGECEDLEGDSGEDENESEDEESEEEE